MTPNNFNSNDNSITTKFNNDYKLMNNIINVQWVERGLASVQ